MDQASLLRELMKKNKVESKNIISIINLNKHDEMKTYNFMNKIISFIKEKNNQEYGILGVDIKGNNDLLDYVNGFTPVYEDNDIIENKDGNLFINGKLNFLSDILKDKNKIKRFVDVIEKVENKTDGMIFNSGTGIDVNVINTTLNSNKIIIMVKPESKYIEDTKKLIKILDRLNYNSKIGIIVDTIDQNIYEKVIDEIDDKKIKGIGFCDSDYLEIMSSKQLFYNFDMSFINENTDEKLFSEKIKEIFEM